MITSLSLSRSPVLPLLSAVLCMFAAPVLFAATITVGPNEAVTRIADAALIAEDGDTVLIKAGEYRADVAVWNQKDLTIRGDAERPVLIADGAIAEGKGLWVIRDGSILVENIAFHGARADTGDGAAIHLESGRLEVRNSEFYDNQHGVMTSDDHEAELIIRDSVIADAPRPNLVAPHLLHVGRIARLELTGNHIRNGYEGHLVKTRARENEIRYNLIFDGPGGGAVHELDLPNGGIAHIVGNVIGQAESTHSPVVVSYGTEAQVWARNQLTLSHNTLVSAGLRAARFLHVWDSNFVDHIDVEAYNNLTVGLGAFTLGTRGTFDGNYPLPPGVLAPDTLDFTLGPRSLLRGLVDALEPEDPLRPTAEFALPAGTVPLQEPEEWVPGAFQSYSSER